MMQYKSQIPKYWWLELLLVTVSDAELGECCVWSKQEKGHGDGYDQKKRLKVFSLNRPFLEIDLSAAKLFLKGSTLNHS